MIKAKKGLLIALFATMMVFAFGATSAFAGTSGSADEGHDWTILEDMSNVEVIVEPTCTTPGYGIVTCVEKTGGVDCTAKHNQVLPALGHEAVCDKDGDIKTFEVTADEYYEQMQKQGWSKEYMDAWMLKYGNAMCVGDVSICKNCGAYLRAGRNNTLSEPESFGRYANREHVNPTTGMKVCDASFTCVKCGKENATNSKYNADTSAAYHADLDNFNKKGNPYKVHSKDNNTKYVEAQVWECDECGLEKKTQTVSPEGTSLSEFSHPNTETMTTMPTCTENGTSIVICKDCGYEISRTETPAQGHKYEKQTVAAATETTGEVVADVCTICGYEKPGSRETVSLPLSHNVTATLFAPKNCADNTMVLVACSNPDCAIGSFFVDSTSKTEAHYAEKIGNKYYTQFGTGKVEIPFEEATGHTYGDKKIIAEATCEDPEVEGRVCSTCGAVYHTASRETGKPLGHEVKAVKVDATCGAYGYTYNICTRCNEYLSEDGKDVVPVMDEFDMVKPVVALGTECSYDWKVLEEATPFTLGTRAKVCTVCNDELFATKESIPKTTIAAPAVKAKKGKKAVVTVKAVEGAVSYQILVNGKVKVKNAKVGKNTVKKLTGKKAKVQIKAFDANGVAAKSKAKTVKVKK